MRSRIILLAAILISFLFSCIKNEKLLLFDKNNNEIILSKKFIGRSLFIYKMKDNGKTLEYSNLDDSETIIIEKAIYNISELGLNYGLYRAEVIYMDRLYYIDISLNEPYNKD